MKIPLRLFLLLSGLLSTLFAAPSDREYSVSTLVRIADPVLRSASEGKLKSALPVHDWEQDRAPYTALEALGRTLAGVAPWLELGPDETEEGKLRGRYIEMAVKALALSTDPASPAYLNFDKQGGQPLVDAAFLAHGLLRAPSQLWGRLTLAEQERVAAALRSSLVIRAGESNWLLFPAMIEAALWKFTGTANLQRIEYAVTRHMEWYKGDGIYGDGPEYHWDYYNSFVIQPMLLQVLEVCREKGHPLATHLPQVLSRARRYAAVQERLISPEGSFPVMGRSSAYRFGALQHLATMALLRQLPEGLSPAATRSALTAVIQRMSEAPGTFDAQGWLQIGAVGHQPSIRERYIATGSLYLCLTGLVHLGLPATDPFWTSPAEPWTQKRIWSGADIPPDKALK